VTIDHFIFIVCLNASIWGMDIYFYCLCYYANAIAFVAHCKYVVIGWVQTLYWLHMLLWKVHKMNYSIIAWHLHMNIVNVSYLWCYLVIGWCHLVIFFVVNVFELYIVHVGLVWMCVFGLRSNNYCLWKHVEDNWLGTYV
jgi:hypothetical protein